jgi:hypothetical protein
MLTTQLRCGALALLAATLGCAVPPPPIPVDQARARLNGLTPQQVAACLGPSPVERTSALGVGEGPIAPAGCIVNVVFDHGHVATVTYAGPNGRLLRQDPECTQVIQACVR